MMATLALIGMGSNLGDRRAFLDQAITALNSTRETTLESVSSFRETTPIGGPGDQGSFLNAAAAVTTTLTPRALLDVLRAVENEADRTRTERWGERTLDLDLLLYGDVIREEADLIIPHPRMVVRHFVLGPLAEIAPHAIDPACGLTIASLLANLDRRPSIVSVHHSLEIELGSIVRELGALLIDDNPPRAEDEIADHTEFERRHLDLWERQLSELRTQSAIDPSRWIVTRFGRDSLEMWRRSRKPEWRGQRDRTAWPTSSFLKPTFMVRARDASSLAPGPSSRAECRALFDGPTLMVDAQTAEGRVAEVLAACRASRP